MNTILLGFIGVLILAVTSCSQYSTVIEKAPAYRSGSPSGQMIAQALKHPEKDPLEQIGRFLDAAAIAGSVLEKNPNDAQAMADYNFAVSRVFDHIEESGLEPWKSPLLCRGASHTWKFSFKTDPQLKKELSELEFLPADRFHFEGDLVVEQTQKAGLGAPLVAAGVFGGTELGEFAHAKHVYYSLTAVVDIKGHDCKARLLDPLAAETVRMDGQTYPLAANYTAAIDLSLAERGPRKKELMSLFKPEDFNAEVGLSRFQPYDSRKIPLLCVHGLGDSSASWAPMIKTLRDDPVIRANYQVWFFTYATGYPHPVSAAKLRKELDAITVRHPDHKKVVLLGHSMGGVICRMMVMDSGMKLWDAVYDKPASELPFSNEDRKTMTEMLIFEHRKDVARVIFMSPPHRGSETATNFLGRLGATLIGAPKNLFSRDTRVFDLAKRHRNREQLDSAPNSVDMLDPDSLFVRTVDDMPLAKSIPYHSILGDRGKGGNLDRTEPVSTDGIVTYWSGHLDGAVSELIIPSDHLTHRDPQGIAEVERILYQHIGKD